VTSRYHYLLLLIVAGCAAEPVTEVPPQTEDVVVVEQAAETKPSPEPAPEPAPVPLVDTRRITIAAVGDMMLGTDYPENILPDDDGVGFLADVAPFLSSADITFGNLEGVLLDGGEPGKKCSNPKACYLFRSPSRYVEHYRNAGFDVMSLANNHARDFGEEGRLASMDTLREAGIHHSGLEGDFATMTVKGLKVAVLAYAVTRNSNLLLDYDLARATVAGYAGTHDIVIVSFHGGAEGFDVSRLPFAEEEYYGEPRGDVVKFSRMMVDAGADLVIGHGPHVIRAAENYKDRLIAYSLGNFATYYGISVEGIKGIAPILVVTLDAKGNFVEGMVHSTIQIRPAGPSIDPEQRALNALKSLSIQDFATPGISFGEDGTIQPAPRQAVRPMTDTW
jgi:poly-gamma-glutamate capsule biosynthesis protein CapA/YwtB (metallophosphatase superfamily)